MYQNKKKLRKFLCTDIVYNKFKKQEQVKICKKKMPQFIIFKVKKLLIF